VRVVPLSRPHRSRPRAIFFPGELINPGRATQALSVAYPPRRRLSLNCVRATPQKRKAQLGHLPFPITPKTHCSLPENTTTHTPSTNAYGGSRSGLRFFSTRGQIVGEFSRRGGGERPSPLSTGFSTKCSTARAREVGDGQALRLRGALLETWKGLAGWPPSPSLLRAV